MIYDIRKGSYLFKHSRDEEPSMSQSVFKEHFHPIYELLYFIKGKADFTLRQEVYHLQHHNLLFVKPGSFHNIIIKEVVPYERVVIRFSPDDISPELNASLNNLPSVFDIRGSLLENEILHLDSYATLLTEPTRERVFLSQLTIILSLLAESETLGRKEDKINTSVARIIEYIDEHLTEIHTVDDIAEGLNMSSSTINKVFMKHIQTPIMKYVRTQKCMLAKSLMTTGLSSYQAAEEAGFDYYSTFYRAYKSIFKTAPIFSR